MNNEELNSIYNHFELGSGVKKIKTFLPNIAFCGVIGSGKTVISQMLYKRHGGRVESFADPLKQWGQEILDSLSGCLDPEYQTLNKAYHRNLLIHLGEKMRDPQFGSENFWVDKINLNPPKNGSIYVDDLRHPAEAQMLKSKGFIIIKLGVSEEEQNNRIIKRDGKFDSEVRKTLSETNNKKIVEDYFIDTTGKDIEQIYNEILYYVDKQQVLHPKTLFYNKICLPEVELTNHFDNPCVRITLNPSITKNIQKYVDDLANYKTQTSNGSKSAEERYLSFPGKKHWLDGFVSEFAVIQFLLSIGIKDLNWDDTLQPHNKGDNGDVIINGQVIDVKAKSYQEDLYNIFYCIKSQKSLKADNYLFTYISYPEMILDPETKEIIYVGSAYVDIIGYQSKTQIERLPDTKRWKFPQGRYIDYNKLSPFGDLIKKYWPLVIF